MIPGEFERRLGINFFSTRSEGLGGRLRQIPEDFVVREILKDGAVADPGRYDLTQQDKGGFLVCIMEKRGQDTFTAVRKVSGRLGIDQNRIDFAGLKDAHALTYQFVTIQRKRPSEIVGLQVSGVKLFPLFRSNRPIGSELLAGNEFEISIRGIQLPKGEACIRAESIQAEILKVNGAANFFGYQRFGAVRPITHVIGRYLLKGDCHGAVMTYLTAQSRIENSSLNEIRNELLETMDFGKAFRLFPKQFEYERILLSYLNERPNDYAGAMRKLPLRLRRLFIHAYQGYLFNKILSERIISGLSLVEAEPGDRVFNLSPQGNLEGEPIEVDCRNIDSLNQKIGLGRTAIVLPIIGLDTTFSGGKQGQIERRIVEEAELDGETYRVSAMPELKAYGGYRTAMMRVSMFNGAKISEDPLNGNMVMATIRFSLPKGSYATILLREFMKTEDPILAGY